MRHATPARENESTVVPLRARLCPEIPAATVDPNDLNSPHTMAVLSVPPGSTVLDVGCGPGVVARALVDRGCKVWGVELDPARATSARNHCVEVLEADVEAVSLSEEFANQLFDVVLFLDVLEHLRNPQAVLAGAEAVLAPGGCVLLSVPNVTHGALRLELLNGKFQYRASGLLDRGHLRFFDADGLDALIRQAGFRAETRLRVTRRLDQTEFDVDLERVPGDLRARLESDPDALTYQFFVIARPARGPQAVNDSLTLVERQQARIGELTAAVDQGAAYARHLQEELQARDARLRELEGSTANADQTRYAELVSVIDQGAAYARHLHEELEARDARLRELEAGVVNAERRRFDELAAAIESGRAYATHLHEDLAAQTARVAELQGAVTSAEHDRLTLERELAAKTARVADIEAAFTDLERQRDASVTRLREVEETVHRLGRELDASTLHVAELERAFVDLTRLSEDSEAYVRHLEEELRRRTGDIAIQDDEMRMAGSHIEKVERILGDRNREIADRDAALQDLRARVEEAEQSLADQAARRDALQDTIDLAGRRIAELEPQLQIAKQDTADSRVLADQLFTLLQQPRHRLAENSNNVLKRWMPWIHRLLRPLVASATRNPPTTTGPQRGRPDPRT
jgi:2-polyprenyl-3-methyl-5-hydroxy-6-metoxy-1,4-benzoquinol methylase/septal ring factor EnvC (AmiA/AmiB activator)